MIKGNFEPIKQIWIFIVGPMFGAVLAALVYGFLDSVKQKKEAAKTEEEAPKAEEEKAE